MLGKKNWINTISITVLTALLFLNNEPWYETVIFVILIGIANYFFGPVRLVLGLISKIFGGFLDDFINGLDK